MPPSNLDPRPSDRTIGFCRLSTGRNRRRQTTKGDGLSHPAPAGAHTGATRCRPRTWTRVHQIGRSVSVVCQPAAIEEDRPPKAMVCPTLHLLVRTPEQLDAALELGPASIRSDDRFLSSVNRPQ